MVLKCLRWSPWPAAAYMRSGGLADLPAFARLCPGPWKGGLCRVTTTRPTSRWRLISGGAPDPVVKTLTSAQDNFRAPRRHAARRLIQRCACGGPKRRIWTPQATPRVCHDALSGMRPSFDVGRAAATGAAARSGRYMFTLTALYVCHNLSYLLSRTSSEPNGWIFRSRSPPDKGHRRTELDD